MNRFCIVCLVVSVCAFTGCRTTSDDPREGGLFGYWQHGEEGYQQRLDRRRGEVEGVQQESEAAQSETARLQKQRDEARAELDRQRGELSALQNEVGEIQAAYESLKALPPEQAEERAQLELDAGELQEEIADLETNTDLLIQERRRKIAELKKELKLLRERTSLLSTL